jgi:Protein of unknown function (DUF3631)
VSSSEPIFGADILEALAGDLRRKVVITPTQANVVALWIQHTHAYDAADMTPYLWITGPERRVGKSRLLEVIALYARKPVLTANISVAATFRLVAREAPTLLLDEVDTVFGGKATDSEDLRGLLNAGFQRGATVWRCIGDGSKQTVEEFPVFCPKAFAGIGEAMPETLVDRAITIRMTRKTRGETIERFRVRRAKAEAEPLHDQLARWAEDNVDRLAQLEPELPDELDDRAQDAWEPLLAIADAVAGEWPDLARSAAIELSTGAGRIDDSRGVRLLEAIRQAFTTSRADELPTRDLIRHLASDDEAEWARWWDDRNEQPSPGAAQELANVLRPFGVRSERFRADETQVRGFRRERFRDAFARYLTPQKPSQLALSDGSSDTSNPDEYRDVTTKTGRPPHREKGAEGPTPLPQKPSYPSHPSQTRTSRGAETPL